MRLADEIRGQMDTKGMSVTEMAEKICCSRGNLSRKINGHSSFTLGEVQRISAVLGMSTAELIARAEGEVSGHAASRLEDCEAA